MVPKISGRLRRQGFWFQTPRGGGWGPGGRLGPQGYRILGPAHKEATPAAPATIPRPTIGPPLARSRYNTHQPQGRENNSDPTHCAKRRTGDCPGPRKETGDGRTATLRVSGGRCTPGISGALISLLLKVDPTPCGGGGGDEPGWVGGCVKFFSGFQENARGLG